MIGSTNTDKRYDVAIVGAGPAGLLCGAELRKLGKEVVVIDKGKRVGDLVVCAGLFNIDGLKRLGIERSDYVLNEVRGAKFFSQSGAVADVRGEKGKAYVVDRGEFDRFLANKFDGELILGKEVTDARREGDAFKLKFIGGGVEADNVVLATGFEQKLHKPLGLKGPESFIATSQYEVSGVEVDPDFVEIYLGSVAPGFFAWVIPVSESKARIGLGVLEARGKVSTYMGAFLKRLKRENRFKKSNRIVHRAGGLIPVFEPGLNLARDGAYLVGDAAGQVKATTGGGVMLGGLAAKILARSIHEGLSYERGLATLNKELKNHLMIRKVINKFGDEQYEHMIEFLNRPEVKRLVEQYGDMDFVAPLMKSVMQDPVLLLRAMKLMGGGLLF